MSEIITAAAHVPQDARNSYAVFRGTLAGNITKIRVYADLFYELRIDESLVAANRCSISMNTCRNRPRRRNSSP